MLEKIIDDDEIKDYTIERVDYTKKDPFSIKEFQIKNKSQYGPNFGIRDKELLHSFSPYGES